MHRITLVLVAFAIVFSSLCISSFRQKSGTADEPINLVAGYTMLRLHDYRIHPENMPLLRMWNALPLLTMPEVKLDTNRVSWTHDNRVVFAFEFLYRDNDADQLLSRARFMVMLLGLGLGVLVFCWTHEWFGPVTATVALAVYATEPNILAHSGIASMDLGISFLIFGTFYFLWRLTQRFTPGNLLGLTGFFAVAAASKTSSLMLVPLVAILLIAGLKRHRLATLALLLVSAYLAIWAAYDFRYLPKSDSPEPFRFTEDPTTIAGAPHWTPVMRWIDTHHLLPNACAQGFALEQARSQIWPSYLAGKTSAKGWWYYFPFAMLIKTPVALLFLGVIGFGVCVSRRTEWRKRGLYVLLPFLAGLIAAMTARMNIGLRHVLPLYPFLIIFAGYAVAELLAKRRRGFYALLIGLCVFQFAENARVYPDYLAFFNTLIGGPRNGHKYLADSNIDWGQDLKELKHWMNQQHVDQIQFSYFGMADPAYYGIRAIYLPGSSFFCEPRAARPVPGYIAVSVHNLVGANPGLPRPDYYRPLLDLNPIAELGHSIHIYRLEPKAP